MEHVLNTTIEDITVFFSQARIMRRGVLEVKSGLHSLRIESLPATLQEDSVRASANGGRIETVEVIRKTVNDSLPAASEQAERVTAIQQALDQLADEETVLNTQLQLFQALGQALSTNYGRTIADGSAQLEQGPTTLRNLGSELAKLYESRREIVAQKASLTAELETLRKLRPSSTAIRTYYAVQIQVAVEEPATLAIEVSYLVNEASWRAAYDLRVQTEQVLLIYQARIQQHTGEDWPMLPITLSTAQTNRVPATPRLEPWRIDSLTDLAEREHKLLLAEISQRQPQMTRPLEQSVDELKADILSANSALLATMHVESVGPVLSFQTVQPIAVVSNGIVHTTRVAEFDLPGRLDYNTIPKVAEQVGLRAKIRNATPLTLVSGPAVVFYEGTYLGRTQIHTAVPGEDMVVSLLNEERIRVRRQIIEQRIENVEDTALKRLTFTVQITLTNYLPTSASVTVRDQLPQPMRENIKVSIHEAVPTPTDQNDLNIIKWVVTLAPQDTQIITLRWMIECPRNMELINLR